MSRNKREKRKIIVILGPTSSGKTRLAVELAAKFNGEIVSADSRQVYRGMDIGTGKDLAEYSAKFKVKSSKLKVIRIPYHLIDVADPREEFNLAQYKRLAERAIDDILSRGRLPFLVGGSGLYLQAVVDNYDLTKTGPNKKSRTKLEKLEADELFLKLKKINPIFAARLEKSDRKNKRRLIRYLEIGGEGRAVLRKKQPKFEALIIGLNRPRQTLNDRIYQRLIDRLEKENLVEEVKKLHRQGVSWRRLEAFGLEYGFVSRYLQGKLNYDEMVEKLNIAIRQFAKRQLTWFRRWERQGKNFFWLESPGQAEKMIKKFIK